MSDTGGLSRAMEAISLRTPRIPVLRCSTYMLLTLGDSVPVMASWCWTCCHQSQERSCQTRSWEVPALQNTRGEGKHPSHPTNGKPRQEAKDLAQLFLISRKYPARVLLAEPQLPLCPSLFSHVCTVGCDAPTAPGRMDPPLLLSRRLRFPRGKHTFH